MNYGNKSIHLNWLKKNGFAVPYFISLTEDECKNQNIILEKTKNLNYPLAVRSSFSGEDGAGFSFAGMFESILNVQDNSELVQAILQVADSLNSARVTDYCEYHKVDKPVWGSIIVQEMVQSKISGVIFTKNPMNEEQLIISSALGLGENLVSGRADSEDALVQRQQPQFTNGKVLNAILQNKLYVAAIKIERLKKVPQDVEWAIDQNDQIFFLQTRDITVNLQKSKTIYFDNSNIQESFIGITLPLTFSYAKNAYRHSYNTLMQIMGFSANEIKQHDWRHQHMLGLIDGRVYYNINSWYEGLLFLPNFGRQKKDMENMMGLENSIDFIETQQLTLKQKMRALPKVCKLILKMVWKFSFIQFYVNRFDHLFCQILHTHRLTQLSKKNVSELLLYLNEVQNKGFALWGVPLANDFYVMIYSGKVRRALAKFNQEQSFPHLLKTQDLESFKPVLRLNELVEAICKSAELSHALAQTSNFLDYCRKNNPAFHHRMNLFIDLYGDRVPGELKLETETFRTQPQLLVDTLKLFAHSYKSKNQKSSAPENQQPVKIKNFLARRQFNSDLKKLQNGIRYRELMRFHRTRSFGIIREIYLKISEKFVEANVFHHTSDIFYLTCDEIADIVTFQSVQNNIQGLIDLRKSEYLTYEKSQKYKNQIQMKFPMTHSNKFFDAGSSGASAVQFKGTGCYPGVISGEICYVKNFSDAQDLEGKILLAERTDPGWTPLFYLAKAVIVEKGSILSHAAIVAREVGIPIIIGVPQITQTLKTGDYITLDGTTGDIKLDIKK